ncbi:MAG: hypothetical protein RR847_02320 [Bacilli bacterium]
MFILVECGGVIIPEALTNLVSIIVKVIYIGVPILLILWGMFDLGRAVISSKEEDIKKGQSTFFKRLIAAVIVFFVVSIVAFVINLLSTSGIDNAENIGKCVLGIINGQ